jgi:hypothetical protein
MYVSLYRGTHPMNAADGVGFAVCMLSVLIEWRADTQLRLWRSRTPDKQVGRRGGGMRLRWQPTHPENRIGGD